MAPCGPCDEVSKRPPWLRGAEPRDTRVAMNCDEWVGVMFLPGRSQS